MNLIVGLGNPGRKYADTRHNTGFRVIEELAGRWHVDLSRRRFDGLIGRGVIGSGQVLLLEPMTYMNRSGGSVREALGFYKMGLSDLLVVVDDLALPLGRLRIRSKGSGGGHNGLIDIVEELGSENFARIRIGIGWVDGGQAVNHVLGPFTPEEEAIINPAICRSADAVESWIFDGIEAAMNKFNRPDESSIGDDN
ncbi:MAG: aminoacyl-tRNA hydrolase [Planctomycetota bacterium]|jgi:PTH1 family peptidyl-tRNA hydrolase